MGFFDNLVDGIFNGGASASDAAMEQYNKIPGVYDKYLSPYINRGDQAYDKYNASLDSMMANGGVDFVNSIYNQYDESPAYKFAAGQATDAAGNAAAAGGTLGTGAHQAQLADYIQGLSSRDQEGFFNRSMGAYNKGMQGQSDIMTNGYNASNSMAQGLAGNYQDMGSLAYNKQEAQTRGAMGIFGMGLGALTGGLGGGAMGGVMGSQGGQLPMPFQNQGFDWGGAGKGMLPFMM